VSESFFTTSQFDLQAGAVILEVDDREVGVLQLLAGLRGGEERGRRRERVRRGCCGQRQETHTRQQRWLV